MIWAALVAVGWLIMAYTVDEDLLTLGRRRFGMPRENCILVAWGFETQQRLMWTKVLFCFCLYIATFTMCIWHAIRQHRYFQWMDNQTKSMKDFAVMLHGLG